MALKHDLELVDDFHGIATLDDVLHHQRRDVVEHLALIEHGIGPGQAFDRFDYGLIFGTGDYERLRYLDQLGDRCRARCRQWQRNAGAAVQKLRKVEKPCSQSTQPDPRQ